MDGGGRWGAVAVLVLAAVASAFPGAFQLDRAAILSGELWRFWTGHLVHASRDHFLFDVGAACLLFCALERPWRSAFHLGWAAPVVGALLLITLPELDVYYGLSGLLHGWAVAGAGEVWWKERGRRSYLAGAFCGGTVAKAALETWTASATFSVGLDMGGPVIFPAHLIGALTGLTLLAVAAAYRGAALLLTCRVDSPRRTS